MKKVNALSIATLLLVSTQTPLQAASLLKSFLLATCLFVANTDHASTPSTAAPTMEYTPIATQTEAVQSLVQIKTIPQMQSVQNREFFARPFPAIEYFRGENVTLSMVPCAQTGESLPSWVTFNKEKYGVYTLFGTPQYGEFFDSYYEYTDYWVIAEDRCGNTVSQLITLHIKGLSAGNLIFSILTTASVCICVLLVVSGLVMYADSIENKLLAGDIEGAEKSRWCYACPGKPCFLCICKCKFELMKERVHKKELEAVSRLVSGENITDIEKKTGVADERLEAWSILLHNKHFTTHYKDSKYNREKLLAYFNTNGKTMVHSNETTASAEITIS